MGGADEARGVPYPSSDCLIANNLCLRNGIQGGIFLNATYSQTGRFLVLGNVCKENGRDGIWAFRAKDGVIANNLCVSNNKPAGKGDSLEEWQSTAPRIRLVACENVVVMGNRCVNAREQKWQVFGICVEGGSQGNPVAHNSASRQQGHWHPRLGGEYGEGEWGVSAQVHPFPGSAVGSSPSGGTRSVASITKIHNGCTDTFPMPTAISV